MPRIALTARDREIIDTLAHRVRFFTLKQVARGWWEGEQGRGEKSARRRLGRLAEGDYIKRRVISTHPELDIREPLFVWKPGQRDPDFNKLAWQCQRRWGEQDERADIYEIGKSGLRVYGGRPGGPKRLTQIRHDLHIGAIYLAIRDTDPHISNLWCSEDELLLERRGEKLPDAMLRASKEKPEQAIEFAGAYDASHIQSFHRDCKSRKLAYQLW